MTIKSILLGISTLWILSSCDQVFFTNPQPNDTGNIYSFPRKLQGIWTDSSDSIIIGDTYFSMIEYLIKPISKNLVDSSSRYIISDDLIYVVDNDDDKVLLGGFPYELINDTIFYTERSVEEIILDKNNFLRKLGKSYIANMMHDSRWWELSYLEITESGDIIIRVLSNEDMNLISNYKLIHTFNERYGTVHYINASWSGFELQKWIEAGAFSDTVMTLRKTDRLKK